MMDVPQPAGQAPDGRLTHTAERGRAQAEDSSESSTPIG
jgi:hypothetical protein